MQFQETAFKSFEGLLLDVAYLQVLQGQRVDLESIESVVLYGIDCAIRAYRQLGEGAVARLKCGYVGYRTEIVTV